MASKHSNIDEPKYRFNLIVTNWIRLFYSYNDDKANEFPLDIIKLIINIFLYEKHFSFHETYKSSNIQLSDDKLSIKCTKDGYGYALLDCPVVSTGLVAWRIKVLLCIYYNLNNKKQQIYYIFTQIDNPTAQHFYLGVSAKKEFKKAQDEKTFYGIWTGLIGHIKDGERIETGIDIYYWSDMRAIEIDMVFDGKIDDGTLKMCVVPRTDNDAEIVIKGVNKDGNINGFVPNLVLWQRQRARVCSITAENYGENVSIDWGAWQLIYEFLSQSSQKMKAKCQS